MEPHVLRRTGSSCRRCLLHKVWWGA